VAVAGYGQTVAPPEFQPIESDSPTALEVVVSHADPTAEIHYTFNGADPVLGDPLVVSGESVTIARTAVLKARAWVGGVESAVAESEYRITGAIAVGDQHALAVSVGGRVWSWGNQWYGRLGNGQIGFGMQLVPAQVFDEAGTGFFETAKGVAAGQLHSVLIDQDGTVRAVGCNFYGALGDNTVTSTGFPVEVLRSATPGDLLPDCVGIGAGEHFSLGLDSSGAVYAWGLASSGRLGNGSIWGSQLFAQPVQRGDDPAFPALDGIREVSAGKAFGLAREPNAMEVAGESGKVWVWGENTTGQLGQGNVTSLSRADTMKLAGGADLDHAWNVSAGEAHSAVVRWESVDPDLQGSVWTCGDQAFGRLGQGSTWFGSIMSPAKVIKADSTPLTGIVQVAAGSYHTLALDQNGNVWAWGYNIYGQLGDGTTVDKGHAVQVNDAAGTGYLGNIVAVAAGGVGVQGASMALDEDGYIWVWGANVQGQLGNGEWTFLPNPLPVAQAQNHVDEGEPSVSLSCTVIESVEEGEAELTATPGHNGPLGVAAIQRVDFYVSGKCVGSAFQAPWTVSAGNLPAGDHHCYAIAHDYYLVTAMSLPGSFTIDLDPAKDQD